MTGETLSTTSNDVKFHARPTILVTFQVAEQNLQVDG